MGGTITAIRIQKKNPRRANLYLDGKFALGLAVEVVQDWGLRRGQVLDDAELEALRRAEGEHRALRDALRLLNERPRSTAEVRDRLMRRGYEEGQVQAVLSRLTELGLLDDRAFARAWVENRRAFRPRGRPALEAELRKKGLAPETIAEALANSTPEEEAVQALLLARRRAPALRGLDRPAFFRRLQAFLARRGFSAAVVRQVAQQVWEEARETDKATAVLPQRPGDETQTAAETPGITEETP